MVAPVLELLEECGVDNGEAKAASTFSSEPNDASLRAKNSFTIGKRKTHIEQAGEFHRLFQAVQSHAACAKVHALNATFVTLLILQCYGDLDAGSEKFLLLEADEAQGVCALAGIDVDVVFLQLSAERATGDAKLFRGLAAMPAAAIQGANYHLLFHAVEIAHRYRGRLTLSGGASRHRGLNLRLVHLGAAGLHRHSRDEVTQLPNIARPGVRQQRGDSIGREGTARSFEI